MGNFYTGKSPSVAEVKRAVIESGRAVDVLRDVGKIPEEFLTGRHCACPHCGEGEDRFYVIDVRSGDVFCRRGCWGGHNRADIFTVIIELRGVSFSEAVRMVAEYLGMAPRGDVSKNAPPSHSLQRKSEASGKPAKSGNDKTCGKGKPVEDFYYPYVDGMGMNHHLIHRLKFADRGKMCVPYFWNGYYFEQSYGDLLACADSPKREALLKEILEGGWNNDE